MPTGYCTVDDVRRALREEDLPGDAAQDRDIVIDAITAQTEWLEKTTKRHWLVDGTRPTEDDQDELLPTATKSRDDEEDVPTGGTYVSGEPLTPKTWHDDYTRVVLDRRDAESISELLVRDGSGYTDWVSDSAFDGGTWPSAVGDDYYLRVNNGGWSHLYLDVTNFQNEDGEYILDSFSNAVYVTFDYGHAGIPQTVRRAVAFRAAADLTEEATMQIPENATVYGAESKAEELREKAEELLEVYL